MQNTFKYVQNYIFTALPNGMAILFLDKIAVAIKSLVEFVGFFKDWYFKIIHNYFIMRIYKNLFNQIISPESLFSAWDAFKIGKRHKVDVAAFELHLEKNIFELHRELKNKTYRHGEYKGFYICDPKQRHIHKATVRDRILHHAVFSVINPIFEPTFISRSFSCRINYGAHKGVDDLGMAARKISKNMTRSCYILKCDIKKFFDSVDHKILLSTIKKKIKDTDAMRLIEIIVSSYKVTARERERESKCVAAKGIPIGNLTSQIFANIYMNEFDQFIKHNLKVKNYFRYTDDFAIVSDNRNYLEELLPKINEFLKIKLDLQLHPNKVSISSLYQGIDFLGYIIFPKHRLMRSKTKHRIVKKMKFKIEQYKLGKISKISLEQSLQSYLGALSHANERRFSEELKNMFWFYG